MAEKEKLIKEKLEHSGFFDFKSFYSYAHNWLSEKEEYGVVEEKYSEKVTGNSRDINIEWKATKSMGDYFKFEMGVDFSVKDLTDVEVEIEGKKKKMNKGKISASIGATIIKDPQNKWNDSMMSKFFRETYDKFVIPHRIDSMQGLLIRHVQSFKDELKSFLELSGKR